MGGLAGVHPADLLSRVLGDLVVRTGIDPDEVGQVIGGCVSQVGEQSFNTTRTAWLAAGLPMQTAATTVDTQCGSSQQATNLATSLVSSGVVDVAIACGVESMSRIPIGANSSKKLGLGVPIPKPYFGRYEFTSQFEGAERIAERWGITRDDCDAFGLTSQQRAARAWEDDRFAGQIVSIEAPDLDDDGNPLESTHLVERDEGLRTTSLEVLAELKPVARDGGVHTAGSSSQISDGAAAALVMSAAKAEQLGLVPRARVVDTCLVGVDPVLMLTGPIDATERLLSRTGLSIDQIDVFEIVRLGRDGVGQRGGGRPRAHQPQRRGHRPGPPPRCHRRVPAHQGTARAAARRRRSRPDQHVLRWRTWHRHPHRTRLTDGASPSAVLSRSWRAAYRC
jgi:acetyl-CoA C-acetyltransferase